MAACLLACLLLPGTVGPTEQTLQWPRKSVGNTAAARVEAASLLAACMHRPTPSDPVLPCCASHLPAETLLLLPLCRDYLAFRNVLVFKQDGGLRVPLQALLG